MKDERLEQEFEEYFKGVNTPGNITGDAKKFVKPRRNVLPKIVKFASIAASFVLVFAVALTIALKSNFNKGDAAPPAADGSHGSSPTTPSDSFKYYTDATLSTESADAYSISSLNKSLKFIENFAIATNSSVNSCEAKYANGKLALAKADISLLSGLTRDDTTVYVEFTDEKTIYNELADYYDGVRNTYRGAEYYLTETTAENGERQFKLHVSYMGVKYYFNVLSSDRWAYEKYLNMIVN
ncbi:MAG: hypothetical protein K2N23_00005 [Clostridia bacterium]|nr:hypothetical protein [Clostridia bacterium]